MKASEYFEKYNESVWEEAHSPGVQTGGPTAQMYIEFITEARDMIYLRKVKTDRSVLSIVSEQNQKWNAIANMFEKKYGASPIARNGFERGFKAQMGI